jgi:predicted nucleic acid-binding protein
LLLSEVLSQTDLNQPAARREVEVLLRQLRGLRWLAVSQPIALKAAELMRQYPKKLRLADAVHVATAAEANAEEFWTNDHALAKISISALKIKTLR